MVQIAKDVLHIGSATVVDLSIGDCRGVSLRRLAPVTTGRHGSHISFPGSLDVARSSFGQFHWSSDVVTALAKGSIVFDSHFLLNLS